MMSGVRFDQIEHFDGKSNLTEYGEGYTGTTGTFESTARKKPEKISDEDWEELETRALSTIHLSLAPELKYYE